MTKKLMDYKGYYGSVNPSLEDGCLFGKIEFIKPLITFEADNISELKVAFQEAVDDYLDDCESDNVDPEISCKGSFNIRIGESMHLEASIMAKEMDISLNEFCRDAISSYIKEHQISFLSENKNEGSISYSGISITEESPKPKLHIVR